MHGPARCGHTEYDKGHCSQPGCPNDLRACTECNQASVRQKAREDVRQMWQAAFGCDPS
jgi:hypothetical protein